MANPTTIALTDGTTTYWEVTVGFLDTDGGVSWNVDFGEKGVKLPKDKPLRLVVTNGMFTIVRATATGYVRGRV